MIAAVGLAVGILLGAAVGLLFVMCGKLARIEVLLRRIVADQERAPGP